MRSIAGSKDDFTLPWGGEGRWEKNLWLLLDKFMHENQQIRKMGLRYTLLTYFTLYQYAI